MSSGRSRSSPVGTDTLAAALEAAAATVLARVDPLEVPTVLVDGRSGAGKTTLARLVAARRGAPVEVVALDDLYPGWDGLDAGVAEARERILVPRRAGRDAAWRRWDWAAEAWAEEHVVPAAATLVVEGSGLLTAETAPLADLAVWLEAPDGVRRARALARDGDTYRPHWDRWARQEERHVARDRPVERADLVIRVP